MWYDDWYIDVWREGTDPSSFVLSSIFLFISFPRLFYLSASDTIQYVDSDVSQFNSFAVIMWIVWWCFSWVCIRETDSSIFIQVMVLTQPRLSQLCSSGWWMILYWIVWIWWWLDCLAFVSEELGLLDSSDPILGSIGIIGLYITILITVGGVIRTYLLPQVTDLL